MTNWDLFTGGEPSQSPKFRPPVNLNETAKEGECEGFPTLCDFGQMLPLGDICRVRPDKLRLSLCSRRTSSAFEMVLPRIENIFKQQFVEMYTISTLCCDIATTIYRSIPIRGYLPVIAFFAKSHFLLPLAKNFQ